MKNIGIQFFFLHAQYDLKLKICVFRDQRQWWWGWVGGWEGGGGSEVHTI